MVNALYSFFQMAGHDARQLATVGRSLYLCRLPFQNLSFSIAVVMAIFSDSDEVFVNELMLLDGLHRRGCLQPGIAYSRRWSGPEPNNGAHAFLLGGDLRMPERIVVMRQHHMSDQGRCLLYSSRIEVD